MKRGFTVLMACALPLWGGAQSLASFSHVMPIAPQGGGGLQRLSLPVAVHQGAVRADLGDLRVFNGRGEVVPFAFAADAQQDQAASAEHALPLFPLYFPRTAPGMPGADTATDGQWPGGSLDMQLRQGPNGTLISLSADSSSPRKTDRAAPRRIIGYVADASRIEGTLAALTLDWVSGPDAQTGRVRIEGSDDLKSWRTLVDGGALVELEQDGQRLTQKRVDVPPTRAKYLRLTWLGKAFELKKAVAEVPAAGPQPVRERLVVGGTPSAAPGEYVFDLGGRLPVERIDVRLPEANTVAPMRIFARTDAATPWRAVVSATFYRLTRDGRELLGMPTTMPPTNERYWKLVVDPRGGGLGKALPQLVVEWQPQSIVFVARGEGPYRLAWGSREAAPAQFALASLIPDYQAHREYSLPLARAGDVTRQVVVEPAALQKVIDNMTWKQAILWLVLLVGVAVLGTMAWRLHGQLGVEGGGKGAG